MRQILTLPISKYRIATAVAILFHLIGLLGIIFVDQQYFASLTGMNLLLMFALLIWTQTANLNWFLFFATVVFVLGFLVEVLGVNTGLIFGDYEYGNALGFKLNQVPVLIGLNWVIVIYCAGVCTHSLIQKAIDKIAADSKRPATTIRALSVIVDGATLAVVFDWLIEPVAVKLGYWRWLGDGEIPLYNYICWFLVSMIFLTVFQFSRLDKTNKFAVDLLLIQAMFFLILRSVLA